MEPFCIMLTGGHPNSLGRTLDVVDTVLAEPGRLAELYDCCLDDDDIVRLRAFNGIRRVFNARPDWFDDYAERFLTEIAATGKPVARWTSAQIFLELQDRLSADQRRRATDILIDTLNAESDWIALNMSMKTLEHWAKADRSYVGRIERRVRELADEKRKSVANGARKLLKAMDVSPL